jgi:hypothetical protein
MVDRILTQILVFTGFGMLLCWYICKKEKKLYDTVEDLKLQIQYLFKKLDEQMDNNEKVKMKTLKKIEKRLKP